MLFTKKELSTMLFSQFDISERIKKRLIAKSLAKDIHIIESELKKALSNPSMKLNKCGTKYQIEY